MTKMLEFPNCPYRFILTWIANGTHHSKVIECTIELVDGFMPQKVAAFRFNYSQGLDTIVKPFKMGEDWYITYATSYTKIGVARLHPNRLEHIDQDEGGAAGFCPVEVVIPYKLVTDVDGTRTVQYAWKLPKDYDEDEIEVEYASFGFYSGCVWGDDSTWKLRYLDFSKLAERKLLVSAPFGHFELPRDGVLCDHINLDNIDEGLLHLSRGESFEARGDGTWRDHSTRSEQRPRAELLRKIALEVMPDSKTAYTWLFAIHPALGMRPDDATCTVEGTVKAINVLYIESLHTKTAP